MEFRVKVVGPLVYMRLGLGSVVSFTLSPLEVQKGKHCAARLLYDCCRHLKCGKKRSCRPFSERMRPEGSRGESGNHTVPATTGALVLRADSD